MGGLKLEVGNRVGQDYGGLGSEFGTSTPGGRSGPVAPDLGDLGKLPARLAGTLAPPGVRILVFDAGSGF